MSEREMTLQEWVERLPEIHAARREYDALRARLVEAEALLREAQMMCREATDLMVGDEGGFVPGGWHEFRGRIDAFLGENERE